MEKQKSKSKRKRKLKRKPGEYSIYRLPLVFRVAATFHILGPFIIFFVRVLAETLVYNDLSRKDFIVILSVLGLSSPLLWWLYYTIFFSRLVITEDGIDFYTWSMRGFTSWDNLRDFDFVPATKRYHEHVIRYEDDIDMDVNPLLRLFHFVTVVDNVLPLRYWVHVPHKYISLINGEMDIERFKQTPLGQDLLQYAPHLFEDENTKPTSNIVNT
jgi:hypothetical protein